MGEGLCMGEVSPREVDILGKGEAVHGRDEIFWLLLCKMHMQQAPSALQLQTWCQFSAQTRTPGQYRWMGARAQ